MSDSIPVDEHGVPFSAPGATLGFVPPITRETTRQAVVQEAPRPVVLTKVQGFDVVPTDGDVELTLTTTSGYVPPDVEMLLHFSDMYMSIKVPASALQRLDDDPNVMLIRKKVEGPLL